MLNSGQFPKNEPADLPYKPEPLPGEGAGKPIATELPLQSADEAAASKAASAQKRAESGKTVVVGKPRQFTAVSGTGSQFIKTDTDEEAEAKRKQRLAEVGESAKRTQQARPRPTGEWLAALQNMPGVKLSRHFDPTASSNVAPGPRPGNKYSDGRAGAAVIHSDKPAIDEELAAKTGIEQPARRTKEETEDAPVVSLAEAAARKAGLSTEDTAKVKRGKRLFSQKEMLNGARSLAREHFERTAPKPDLSEYRAAFVKHQTARQTFLRQNPEPQDYGTKEWNEWSEKSKQHSEQNPAPSTEPVEKARAFSDALFKDSEAYKTPRNYLKKVMGLKSAKHVDVHVETHLKGLKEIDADTTPVSRKGAKPTLDLSTRKEISPERSAQVETFAKNPMTLHFGTGSQEGKR